MREGKRALLRRFPEFEPQIQTLSGNNRSFDALCAAFGQASDGLARLEGSAEPDAEAKADDLRRRCADLEQELLALMQQTARV